MIEIPLSQGKVALVDDADYELVSQFKWHASKSKHDRTFYARTTVRLANGKRFILRMHRLILNAPPHSETDHRDGDGLNNQRANLRFCTSAQNQMNVRTQRTPRSPFKGVYLFGRRWWAHIRRNGKRIYLGPHDTPEEAALVYDAKARELFGEFARPNFPIGDEIAVEGIQSG